MATNWLGDGYYYDNKKLFYGCLKMTWILYLLWKKIRFKDIFSHKVFGQKNVVEKCLGSKNNFGLRNLVKFFLVQYKCWTHKEWYLFVAQLHRQKSKGKITLTKTLRIWQNEDPKLFLPILPISIYIRSSVPDQVTFYDIRGKS